MLEIRLSKMTLRLWYTYAYILFCIICIISLLVSLVLPTVSLILVTLAVLAGLFAVLFYLPAVWRGVRICISDAAIDYTVGLFLRREHILPLDRLLFMQKVTTPVSALYNMCSLCIKALGGYLLLPEMESEKADIIIRSCSKKTDE